MCPVWVWHIESQSGLTARIRTVCWVWNRSAIQHGPHNSDRRRIASTRRIAMRSAWMNRRAQDHGTFRSASADDDRKRFAMTWNQGGRLTAGKPLGFPGEAYQLGMAIPIASRQRRVTIRRQMSNQARLYFYFRILPIQPRPQQSLGGHGGRLLHLKIRIEGMMRIRKRNFFGNRPLRAAPG